MQVDHEGYQTPPPASRGMESHRLGQLSNHSESFQVSSATTIDVTKCRQTAVPDDITGDTAMAN